MFQFSLFLFGIIVLLSQSLLASEDTEESERKEDPRSKRTIIIGFPPQDKEYERDLDKSCLETPSSMVLEDQESFWLLLQERFNQTAQKPQDKSGKDTSNRIWQNAKGQAILLEKIN